MTDNDFGRTDKRQSTVLVVDIVPLGSESVERRERTYTDNISVHGVCLHSRRPWQAGEEVEIIPLKEDAPVRGEVVYCQKRGQDHFVGIKLRQRRRWSILQRFGTS